ncbi:hypothetical protein CEXT_170271 [Caerostris extrusa]|uniref:Uncharacterized protein n=1 Tax=Caerostris extrusa TaxID=172846 RepID=A0AAV4U5Y5_CAEEX|nr:hypothetical protein CEXT_170271 [Caerostris extrusa]
MLYQALVLLCNLESLLTMIVWFLEELWTHYLLNQDTPFRFKRYFNSTCTEITLNTLFRWLSETSKLENRKRKQNYDLSVIDACPNARKIFPYQAIEHIRNRNKISPHSSLCECVEHLLQKMSKCTGKK